MTMHKQMIYRIFIVLVIFFLAISCSKSDTSPVAENGSNAVSPAGQESLVIDETGNWRQFRGFHAAGIAVVSDNIDIANARLEFVNGAVANVTASRMSAKNERKFRLFQKNAYISIDFANHTITHVYPAPGESAGLIPGMRIDTSQSGKTCV